jgi:hypothetical protein
VEADADTSIAVARELDDAGVYPTKFSVGNHSFARAADLGAHGVIPVQQVPDAESLLFAVRIVERSDDEHSPNWQRRAAYERRVWRYGISATSRQLAMTRQAVQKIVKRSDWPK